MDKKLKEKLILSLLEIETCKEGENNKNKLLDFGIDKVCMLRTYSAGVHFGTLKERNNKECLLEDSKRVYYWEGACSLSQLAIDGSTKIENCKISVSVKKILLTEVIEIIPMTNKSLECLNGVKTWKK